MKNIFSFFVIVFLVSFCAQKTIKDRNVSSNPVISFDPTQEKMLSLPPTQCPPDTQLQSGIVDVDIQKCLKNYIHEKTTHGVTRARICFPPETKHEARLRIPPQNRIYDVILKSIYLPTNDAESRVVLKLNHAYYSIQWEGPTSVSAKEVQAKIKSTPLPKKVSLERCECDTSQFSNEECLKKLSPLAGLEQTYFMVLPQ